MKDNLISPSDYDLDLPISQEEIEEELSKKGNDQWATMSLTSHSTWVSSLQRIWFRDRFVYLIPWKNNVPPHLTTTLNEQESAQDVERILLSFLAALSWAENISLVRKYLVTGNHPSLIRDDKASVSMLIHSINIDAIPNTQDEKARLALAFYRDGLSLDHIHYKFLSFFKIINMIKNHGPEQERWINSKLDKLSYDAKIRINAIKNNESDVGGYLYKSGRCAVAHAWDEPIADPDNPNDLERLRNDMILIEELAALAIEEEFGIQSPTSLYKNGKHRIQKFLDLLERNQEAFAIRLNIRLNIRGTPQNKLTETLSLKEIVKGQDLIRIDAEAFNGCVIIRFFVDLKENNLLMNVDNMIKTENQIINNELIEYLSSILMYDYIKNGRIGLYSLEGERLATSIPYMPDIGLGRNLGFLKQKIEEKKQKLVDANCNLHQ